MGGWYIKARSNHGSVDLGLWLAQTLPTCRKTHGICTIFDEPKPGGVGGSERLSSPPQFDFRGLAELGTRRTSAAIKLENGVVVT